MEGQIMITFLTVVFGIFIANAALIIPLYLWNRKEVRDDIRMMHAKLETIGSMSGVVSSIHDEIHGFHRKLKEIEDKNK